MARLTLRQRRRYTILGGLLTIVLLYLYLSTDTLSSSSFDTKHYSHASMKHVRPTKHPAPLSLTEGQIQFDFKAQGRKAGDPEKAKTIVDAMKKTFWSYRKKAWGADEILPITGNKPKDKIGWAPAIVDTLTTTALMGLEEEFLLELNYTINELNFAAVETLVDPFETTIRYLGALVSTVDLIDSGVVRKGLVTKEDRDLLLKKAVQLAELLIPSFDSPNGMIWPRVNFTSSQGVMEPEDERLWPTYKRALTSPSRAGTNFLENRALTKLARDSKYVNYATRAWAPLVWAKHVEDMPGLLDSPIDIVTGSPLDQMRSWGPGHDSYYEYLIKAHLLAPKDRNSPKYRERWLQAVNSTIKHLAIRGTPPMGEKTGKLFLAHWRAGKPLNEMSHATCFAGGNFILGGKYTDRKDIIETGLELVDTCHHLYSSTITQVGPETAGFIPEEPHKPEYEPHYAGHINQVKEHGFWIVDARWMHRPETIESYFYAYRITGDKIYQEWAWDAFNAIVNASTAENGFAEIADVTRPAGPNNQNDKTGRYWGAETLKYFYLIFADEDVANLDEWVFNTEAHPLRIITN